MSEREIMQSFAFKHEVKDLMVHSSLSETMTIDGDHVLISYNNEFEGKDLNNLRKNLRRTSPKFSSEPSFMRDVQTVFDENYLNYYLFNLFETDQVFSLTELLFEYWPENWMGGPTAIRGLMSA